MDDCIEWTGYIHPRGYGRIYLRGEGRYMQAHRWAWEQEHGLIPAGMVVMHLCDNPPCINVSHLRLATQAENLADMKAKNRSHRFVDTHPTCKKGHPYTDENTWHGTRDGYAIRKCRTCERERMRMYRSR